MCLILHTAPPKRHPDNKTSNWVNHPTSVPSTLPEERPKESLQCQEPKICPEPTQEPTELTHPEDLHLG